MDTVDDRVHREDLESITLRLRHSGIVTNADDEPRRRRRQKSLDASNQLALGQFGYGHFA